MKTTPMQSKVLLILTVALAVCARANAAGAVQPDTHVKPRVIATTDGEIDDRSTMVRFLMYSSDYDVMGIVQVNSRFQRSGHSGEKWLEAQLDAYEKVLPNLRKHNPAFPDANYLRSVSRVGNENINDLQVAPPDMATKNTAGAQLIIDTLLDQDPRPVHVLSWGGANTTASALWKLKTEYPKEKYDYAVSRIRIYCIWYQDAGGAWIQNNIPGAYINEAYRWAGVWNYSSVTQNGRTSQNPLEIQALMSTAWIKENVQTNHGPLGALDPQLFVSEGDTPSFLHLINNGLRADEDYTLGGWGGRSVYDNRAEFPNHVTDQVSASPALTAAVATARSNLAAASFAVPANQQDIRAKVNALRDADLALALANADLPHITDDGDRNKMYWRWIPAAENDFAARMDWNVKDFKDANHPPVAKVTGALKRDVKAGETVRLVATATDPDGNKLTAKWWEYADADSAVAKVNIANSDSLDKATLVMPNEPGKQVHVILEVTDNGTPSLVGYQRIIFNIK